MPRPDEIEYRCPNEKCGHVHWDDENRARHFTVTCGVCMTPMKRTGNRKVDGELVVPEPPKQRPTKIPVDTPKLIV